MNYCDSPQEQAENPIAKQAMAEIANGDASAFQWMWDFWCFTHVIDDLVDKDKSVSGEQVAQALVNFVGAMALNPFFLKHACFLHPLIVSCCNRWVDGDLLSKSDNERDRVRSEAVRCGDVDIFLHVAFLTGGWEHMRNMSAKARRYDRNLEN